VQHVQQFQQIKKYTYMNNKDTFILIKKLDFVGTCRILLERVGTASSCPTMLDGLKISKSLFLTSKGCFWLLLELLERLDGKMVSLKKIKKINHAN
jgi:hypothetical protein